MASTYTTNTGIELIGNGEQSGTWGETTNLNFQIIDRLTNGVGSIELSGTSHALTTTDGGLSDGQYAVLVFGGSPSGTNTITISPNTQQKVFIVRNVSGQTIVLSQGSGGNVTVLDQNTKIVYCDGAGATAEVVDVTIDFAFSDVNIDGGTIDGTTIGVTVPAAGSFTNVSVTGTVDGRNVAADGTKLDGIEAGATADQTPAQIKVSYESNANTNAFTDAEKSKLSGVEAGADVTDTANVTAAGALMDSELTNLTAVKAINQGLATGNSPTFAGATFSGDLNIADRLVHSGDTNTAVRFPAADTITMETSGAERVRVTSAGNVGIGTPSPASKLDINGDLGISDKIVHSGDTNTSIRFPATDTFSVETNGAERLRVNSSGFLGVGTTSPLAPVHTVRTGASVAGIFASTTADARISLFASGAASESSNFIGATGNSVYFGTDGSERVRIAATGDVGIGTNAPSAKLDVNGSINLSGANTEGRSIEIGAGRSGDGASFLDLIGDLTYNDYGARFIRNGGANADSVLTHRGTGGLVTRTEDAGFFAVQTNGVERMRVDPSGNILIGTSVAGNSKLRIVGLPTSSAGLSAGDVWNDSGTLKIA